MQDFLLVLLRCGWKMPHCCMFGTMPHLLTLQDFKDSHTNPPDNLMNIRVKQFRTNWKRQQTWIKYHQRTQSRPKCMDWTWKTPPSEAILWLSRLQKEQGPGFPWCCHSPHHQRPAKMEITRCIVLTNHLFWKAGHKFDISAASVRSVHLHIQSHLRQT